MIDFHTHILPNIDDGPSNVEDSIQMLNLLKNQGLTNIVLTPHYYCLKESIDSFVTQRNKSFEALAQTLADNDFVFTLGAEVLLHKNLFINPDLELLKIGKTDYMLVELNLAGNIDQTLYNIEQLIYSYNIIPIISHIENYPYFKRYPNTIIDLIKLGCLIQINTCSINGLNKLFIQKLIKHNFVHLIGTDCHNNTSRKPVYADFKQFISKKGLNWFLDYVEDNGKNILENNKIRPKEPKPFKRALIF